MSRDSMEGEFLDTNILFDGIYPTRALHQNFHKTFSSAYLLKSLYITISVDTEAQIIATESVNFLVPAIYNAVRAVNWDGLSAQQKDALIKQIDKLLEGSPAVKAKNRTTFVHDAIKAITPQLQTLTKSEIITRLCPNLHYMYTRNLQGRISEHFVLPPVDGTHRNYKGLYDAIKDANRACGAFTLKEDHDFDILSDLTLLASFGARYANNITQSFDRINFYSRDDGFDINFKEFKEHFTSNPNKTPIEASVEGALGSITLTKPY